MRCYFIFPPLVPAFCLTLLVLSFVPTYFVTGTVHGLVIDVVIFIPQFFITVSFVFFVMMASLFNQKEKNALASAEKTLRLILRQDGLMG